MFNSLIGKKKLGEYGNIGEIVDVDYLGLGWVTIDFGWYEIKTWEWDFEDAPNNIKNNMNNTLTLIAEIKIQKRDNWDKTDNYCDRIKRIIEDSLTDTYMYEADDVEVTISEKTPILKTD